VFVELVFDRSGSMISLGDTPVVQTLKILRDLRKLALGESNNRVFVSLTVFDTDARTYIDNEDIVEIEDPAEEQLVQKWL